MKRNELIFLGKYAKYSLFFVSFLLLGLTLYKRELFKQDLSVITFASKDQDGYSYAEIDRMLKINEQSDAPLRNCFWKYKGVADVENPNSKRKIEADIYISRGDTRLLFDTNLSCSSLKTDECIIGHEVSQKLYGCDDIQGLPLQFNGELYTVKEVIYDVGQVVILPAKNDEHGITYMTVSAIESKNVRILTDEVCKKQGFNGVLIDFTVMLDIVNILLIILIIIIVIQYFNYTIKYRKQMFLHKPHIISDNRKMLRQDFVSFVILLLSIFLFVIAVYRNFQIVQENLPTKWSEFEFWGRRMNSFQIRLRDIICCEKKACIYNTWIDGTKLFLYTIELCFFFCITILGMYIGTKEIDNKEQ